MSPSRKLPIAGLRTCEHSFLQLGLLIIASQENIIPSALIMIFVLTYRCGAVPVSHRIPYYAYFYALSVCIKFDKSLVKKIKMSISDNPYFMTACDISQSNICMGHEIFYQIFVFSNDGLYFRRWRACRSLK